MFGEIYSSLRTKLRDKEYSEGYAESFLNTYVATQIKVIREQRGMTQAQLGESVGTTQGGISRYENVNYSSWSLRTLIKLARVFNVRLRVSFEPFGTLPTEVVSFSRENLERSARDEDPGLSEPCANNGELVSIDIYKAFAGIGQNNGGTGRGRQSLGGSTFGVDSRPFGASRDSLSHNELQQMRGKLNVG